MRNKKQFIIEAYIKNPHMDLDRFALENYIDQSHVKRTVSEYKKLLSVSYDLYCEVCLSDSSVFYLFSAEKEIKIETKNGRIVNNVRLTDYEKCWLEINKRIY